MFEFIGEIDVGSNIQGQAISTPGEVDVYQVDLVGDVDYDLAVLGATGAGGSLPDPAVAIVDGNGNILASNDDSLALGLDPMLQFSAPQSGTYFLAVLDATGSTGDYTLVFDQAGPPVSFGS